MTATPAMSSKPATPVKSTKATDQVRQTIERARSGDLVFAIVAHLGSAEAAVRGVLIEELTKGYEYESNLIDASELIADAAKLVGSPVEEAVGRLARTENLQVKGDWLRETFGHGIIAGLAIQKIGKLREDKAESQKPLAFIIDSLKHPDEVDVLRDVYGDAFFWLVLFVVWKPEYVA